MSFLTYWYAKLTNRTCVVLVDHQGVEYVTIRRKSKCGGPDWCYVYNFTRVGHVILHEGGETGGQSTYIEQWFNLI